MLFRSPRLSIVSMNDHSYENSVIRPSYHTEMQSHHIINNSNSMVNSSIEMMNDMMLTSVIAVSKDKDLLAKMCLYLLFNVGMLKM